MELFYETIILTFVFSANSTREKDEKKIRQEMADVIRFVWLLFLNTLV